MDEKNQKRQQAKSKEEIRRQDAAVHELEQRLRTMHVQLKVRDIITGSMVLYVQWYQGRSRRSGRSGSCRTCIRPKKQTCEQLRMSTHDDVCNK